MSDTFSYDWGGRGICLWDLSRVVIEGSLGLGKRLERHAKGSWTDLKNLRESCSRRSTRVAAQYNVLM